MSEECKPPFLGSYFIPVVIYFEQIYFLFYMWHEQSLLFMQLRWPKGLINKLEIIITHEIIGLC